MFFQAENIIEHGKNDIYQHERRRNDKSVSAFLQIFCQKSENDDKVGIAYAKVYHVAKPQLDLLGVKYLRCRRYDGAKDEKIYLLQKVQRRQYFGVRRGGDNEPEER